MSETRRWGATGLTRKGVGSRGTAPSPSQTCSSLAVIEKSSLLASAFHVFLYLYILLQ